MKKGLFRLLALAFGAGLLWVCAYAAFAVADRPKLLADLISAPAAKLSARASELVARYPDETRLLTLDLIFYRWANEKYGMAPGIERLDQVAGSLASVSADPAVGWAVANLGSREWVSRATASEADNERVRLLSKARQDLRTALDYGDRSPTRSIESLTSCADALNALGLDLSYAFIATRLAERQFYAVHRYRDAEDNYGRAHSGFTVYGLRAHVARIFDDLGHLQSEVGRYDDARLSYKFSAREWQMLGRGDLAGKQFINAGSSLAADGKLDLALSTMQYGLNISRTYAHDAESYATHAQLLLQVASFCSNRGLQAEARDLLTEAEGVAERANDPLLQAVVLRDEAAAWKALGMEPRGRECLTKREKVLANLIQEGTRAAAKLSDPSLSAAEQSALLAAAEKGAAGCAELRKYQQGADILKQVAVRYEALKRDDDRIRALRSLALHYDGLEDYQAALLARSQAAELAKRIGKRALVVDILSEIEQSARELGDTQTALEALRESVDLIQESGDVLALADVLESRGALLDSMGQTSEAIRDLERAASTYAAELGEPWSQARVLLKLAGVQASAGKTGDAMTSLSTAISRIEQWASTEGIDPNAEPGRADMIFSLYLQLIGLQINEGRKEEAVERLRKAREYTWFGRLRSILTASGESAAAEVLKELDKTTGEIPTKPPLSTGGVRKIASGWSAVLGQVAEFSRLARGGRNPGHAATIDAAEIYKVRSRLPDGLALIEYVVSDTGVCVLLATRSSASCWELPAPGKKIQDAVQAFRKALAETEKKVAAGISVPPVKTWRDPTMLPVLDPLYSLEDMLFRPLRGELSKVTTLVFILPDELSGVPFHALPRDKGGTVRFLIQDYVVSYVSPGMLAGFLRPSPVPINAKKGRVAIFADSSGAFPGAMAEAARIRALYGQNSKLYTATGATAERFVSAASSSNVIHIAAHHRLDPNPAQFAMVLSGKPGGAGTVRLADLMRVNNPNLELAVLSACETISTSDTESAGAPYTAEIFALAGFPSVIGGLWKVSDDASKELMGNFYQSLASQGQKGVALQRAQKSMIESKDGKYAHPFYWASFALYGDPR